MHHVDVGVTQYAEKRATILVTRPLVLPCMQSHNMDLLQVQDISPLSITLGQGRSQTTLASLEDDQQD